MSGTMSVLRVRFAPVLALALSGCAGVVPPTIAPLEAVLPGKRGVAEHAMIASAHPLATEAGLEILRSGGNAVDAAVAAGFAIGVVEPMMSGIGGGGAMLLWRQAEHRADHADFYATAPAAPDLSLREFRGGSATPRMVAVPGLVAGLLEAHRLHGTLPRERVLAPAIRLAEEGFPVGALLARTIAGDSAKLTATPAAQRIFWPGHRALRAGEVLRQPELASTLRRIVEQGRDGFYRGEVAREIIDVLRAGGNPMTLEDLAAVHPRWRRPVCGSYRGYQVLSAPPPQSGVQIVQALNLLEPYDLRAMGLPSESPSTFTLLVSALRTTIADRNQYVGDPGHSSVPAAEMSSDAYAAARAVTPGERPVSRALAGDPARQGDPTPEPGCAPIEPFGALPDAVAAIPRANGLYPRGPGPGPRAPSGPLHPGGGLVASVTRSGDEDASDGGETTHLSVVDEDGNAVSLTITQGVYFGSGAFAAGTFLNSAMNLFSDDPDHPNALGPSRVPRSTTTPTILLEDGAVHMVVGSPGAGRIPPAVLQSIIYAIDYGLDPLTALSMPRINPHFSTTEVEFEQGLGVAVLESAAGLGYRLTPFPPTSLHFGGVHMIRRLGDRWVGAADPRRDGSVGGY